MGIMILKVGINRAFGGNFDGQKSNDTLILTTTKSAENSNSKHGLGTPKPPHTTNL